ncbi:MAG: hypothetical protein IID59_09255, partial [Proteobacteria bacterium]|nr:hypothetical protein [Pseudomonadota bacterium]
MAEAVAETIANFDKLVIEAGTGTGKTFAYLLPAMMSGRKTIISTGTKALQDQLYHRDLPLISKAIGRPIKTALLKGRANYLCLHRLEQIDEYSPALVDDLNKIREWRYRTSSGDRAELTDVAEDSPVWPLVTSTADNCLGQKCPLYSECHVAKARRGAQEADLVVVNHHLLLADLAMKEEGFVEFLPDADAIIIDEAHSSQSGELTRTVHDTLSDDNLSEDWLMRQMKSRKKPKNLCYFAFTATPKHETLEKFGEKLPNCSYSPFSLYSMKQAIEEDFILDVLTNYTKYRTYFKLIKSAEKDPRVPRNRALST